jgi:predicted XRE-type DNA-binding protein
MAVDSIDTSFKVVDHPLEGLVDDAGLARIEARLEQLLEEDAVLKNIRVACNVAQKDVAEVMGITASAVAQLEARELASVGLGTISRYFEGVGYHLVIGLAPICEREFAAHEVESGTLVGRVRARK